MTSIATGTARSSNCANDRYPHENRCRPIGMQSARLSAWLCVMLVMPAVAFAQSSGAILIVNANVIDGVSAEPIRGAHVLIRDGRIEKVAPGKVDFPEVATVIDLQGRWLLPGLIDGHVHIADLRAARMALASGVTTARSMGVSHFIDVGLRDLHRVGDRTIPDFIAAGYHIRPNVAPELALQRPDLRELLSDVRGDENVRRVVRAMLERNVDVIKIHATERAGLADTDPRKRTFTQSEMSAIVDEARKGGITVAAHAHGEEGAVAAVRAGVKTIEHGTYVNDATLQLMAARGICLDPTISVAVDGITLGGNYDNTRLAVRASSMLPRLRETTRHALKFGVIVVAGTDGNYGPTSAFRIGHEVMELIALGMPSMDAIKGATSAAAACYGIEKRTGAIKAGLEADLIVTERDPRSETSGLLDILLVINDGFVAIDRLRLEENPAR